MRIDLFLKKADIIRRRKVAHDLCNRGMVFLNGKEAKPGKAIHTGDNITIDSPGLKIRIKVVEAEEGRYQKIVDGSAS